MAGNRRSDTLLAIGYTKVSDAGLVHLEGLTNLKRMDLMFTQTTDAGVKQLQQALPNCKIGRFTLGNY